MPISRKRWPEFYSSNRERLLARSRLWSKTNAKKRQERQNVTRAYKKAWEENALIDELARGIIIFIRAKHGSK